MRLPSAMLALSDGQLPVTFEGLQSQMDSAWIEEALSSKGVVCIRERKLPAASVMWLVIGMALYRDEPMEEVVHRLGLVMPKKNGHAGEVSKAAIGPARKRVGEDSMKALFQITAREWSDGAEGPLFWRGLRVLGVDGTTLRVPDSPENRKAFELPKTGRNTSGYPQVRAAVLMDLRSRLWVDFDFSGFETGEGTVAWPLIQRVPDESVTIMDRFYVDYLQWYRLRTQGTQRHWVVRGRKNMAFQEVQKLGDKDWLVEVEFPRALRREHPELPRTFMARRITYQRKGFPPRELITSLLDAVKYPAEEMAELYHERWDMELSYDELKTDVLKNEETIRSETPEGVRQELWGIAIAYNLVRREMASVAAKLKVPARRISFSGTLRVMQDLFFWRAGARSPGAIPRFLQRYRKKLKKLLLPPRSTDRSYPRHVKVKMSGYLRNHGHPTLTRKMGLK